MEIIETYLDQAGVKRTMLGYKYLAYAIGIYRDRYRDGLKLSGEIGICGIVGDAFGEQWKTVHQCMARALRYALYVEEGETAPSKFIRIATEVLFDKGE